MLQVPGLAYTVEAEAEGVTCMPHPAPGPAASKRLPYVLHVRESSERYTREGECHNVREETAGQEIATLEESAQG